LRENYERPRCSDPSNNNGSAGRANVAISHGSAEGSARRLAPIPQWRETQLPTLLLCLSVAGRAAKVFGARTTAVYRRVTLAGRTTDRCQREVSRPLRSARLLPPPRVREWRATDPLLVRATARFMSCPRPHRLHAIADMPMRVWMGPATCPATLARSCEQNTCRPLIGAITLSTCKMAPGVPRFLSENVNFQYSVIYSRDSPSHAHYAACPTQSKRGLQSPF
jgi:hypothetical protein